MVNFDIKTSKPLNESKSGNFVFEPVDNICNVQIFENINMESCGEMIARLSQIINQLPAKKILTTSAQIISPYDISPNTFVFDVIINAPGGDINTYRGIVSMFALAKSKGAIIRTQNIGYAASCASLLAVQGTPGYRVMFEHAYNLVHYGRDTVKGERDEELKLASQQVAQSRDMLFSAYKKYTKLTDDELSRYRTTENAGKLFAKKCLTKGLCDWILTSDGELIGRGGR